jgi:hypothetical protein
MGLVLFPICSLLTDAYLKSFSKTTSLKSRLTANCWLLTFNWLNFPMGPCYIALAQTTHKTLLPTICLLFCVFTAAEMCLLHYCSTMATSSCSIIPAFSHHITILLSLLRCNYLHHQNYLHPNQSLSATTVRSTIEETGEAAWVRYNISHRLLL